MECGVYCTSIATYIVYLNRASSDANVLCIVIFDFEGTFCSMQHSLS